MENCSTNAIRKIHFSELYQQTIIVDTSIYLYKFTEKGSFIENMYLFISMFREYGIVPVFIYDGKPPPEKKELLDRRRMEKDAAEKKFKEIKKSIENLSSPDVAKDLEEMEELKKKFVRLQDRDIANAKELMKYYGVNYVESRGEADQLCAYLTKHNYSWGCMSDDMDMFLYGCPRVLRHVSLMNHTAVLYDTSRILRELRLSFASFKDIMILSGTDYNLDDTTSLSQTLEHFGRYVMSGSMDTFYNWLDQHTDYIRNRALLNKVHSMFDLSEFIKTHGDHIREVVADVPFKNKLIQMTSLRVFMEQDGFIFSI